MAILTVGPTSTYPTIAAAMAAGTAGDTIVLEAGYSNETATVTHDGMFVTGDATSTGIVLSLGAGVAAFTLQGTAPINVLDALDGDDITGNSGANVIAVSGGADTVEGGIGDDRLIVDYSLAAGAVTATTANVADGGGLGTVAISGFENFTILTGSFNDTITTGAGDDVVNAGGGDDTINTLGGNDLIYGGDGPDTINAGSGANTVYGGSGNDTITALDDGNFIDGGTGDNSITTGVGADVIVTGLTGADTIIAGGGNDVVTVSGGVDTVDSGAGGNDRVIVDYSASTTAVTGGFTGGTGLTGTVLDASGNSVGFTFTENLSVIGGSGADVLLGGDGADAFSGGIGNDNFTGSGGNDTLNGGADSDTAVYSGARASYTILVLSPTSIQVIDNRPGSPDGTDTLDSIETLQFADGPLAIVINPFNDDFTMAENGTAAGTVAFQDLNGQAVTYAIAGGLDSALFTIDSATGALKFIAGPDFEEPTDGGANNVYDVNVIGTHGGGASETRTIQVTVTNVDGNDIKGTKGKDVVNTKKTVGGEPKPTGEEDKILGKKGNDKLAGLDGNDLIKGGAGNDKLLGNDGDDQLKGGVGNDKLSGHEGDDVLQGGRGVDILKGNAGNDVLKGGADIDKLFGKAGDDLLSGGQGIDVLTGGKGADTFYFAGNLKQADVVKDFGAGDMIELQASSFSGLAVGALSQTDFDDHFNYKNGKLSYDQDGSGGNKAVVFAVFSNKADIGASDILVG